MGFVPLNHSSHIVGMADLAVWLAHTYSSFVSKLICHPYSNCVLVIPQQVLVVPSLLVYRILNHNAAYCESNEQIYATSSTIHTMKVLSLLSIILSRATSENEVDTFSLPQDPPQYLPCRYSRNAVCENHTAAKLLVISHFGCNEVHYVFC